MPRIPFADAIAEPRLLKGVFEQDLSMPQRASIKALYGAPLDDTTPDDRGWTELDYYWAFRGYGTFDDLGYVTKVTRPGPYQAEEFAEGWFIYGVRSGKTDRVAAPIVVYEALCGGHEDRVRKGRPAMCFLVAQDLRLSKYALSSINAILEQIPFVAAGTAHSWIVNRTADRIDLKNNVTIAVCPPTVKSIRGYDAPVAVLDEVGVWYTMQDSANPDTEVYNQITSRQSTFEFPKIVGISSPWAKHGLLYERWQQGTNGERILCRACRRAGVKVCPHAHTAKSVAASTLVLHAPTAALANPQVSRDFLKEKRQRDPLAFDREYKAVFASSVSGFLSGPALEACVDRGVVERPPEPTHVYVAALDPAFRQDAFACAIAHVEEWRGVVIDAVRQFKPLPGLALDPAVVLADLAPLLRAYGIFTAYTDQYQLESLGQLAMQHGFSLDPVQFTATSKAAIYGSLQQLVAQRRLALLDHAETLQELGMLERRSLNGRVHIQAPEGQHDDLATVIAIVCYKCLWLLPVAVPEADPIDTPFQKMQRQIARRYAEQGVDIGAAEAMQQAYIESLTGRLIA